MNDSTPELPVRGTDMEGRILQLVKEAMRRQDAATYHGVASKADRVAPEITRRILEVVRSHAPEEVEESIILLDKDEFGRDLTPLHKQEITGEYKCPTCGANTHRDDAMDSRCDGCEWLVRQCICTHQES